MISAEAREDACTPPQRVIRDPSWDATSRAPIFGAMRFIAAQMVA
jgi:hypothetical protein